MARGAVSLLSLPVVAGLLAVLTLALLVLGRSYGLGETTFLLLVVPVALAVAYLAWYRTLPLEPAPPRRARPASTGATSASDEDEQEPFEDPVEEADRWHRADEDEMADEVAASTPVDDDAAEPDEAP